VDKGWQDLVGPSDEDARLLEKRFATFHRRHRRRLWRDWTSGVLFFLLAAWLTVLVAAFIVVH
jgi:hypothetical protein